MKRTNNLKVTGNLEETSKVEKIDDIIEMFNDVTNTISEEEPTYLTKIGIYLTLVFTKKFIIE